MADYIYLLEHRLSAAQRSALRTIREVARSKALTVFLVGGAVRDLTSGFPVRDLDVVVQGNALKLKKDIEKTGAVLTGEQEPSQSLYWRFPGNVRMEVGSTLSVLFPKPGKAVYKSATILEDLRRRDFTANAMALSLNEGSYGLLMDPLNGVADIENRELRLVSNYGFIEDPVRMIRAARLMARLGWTLDEKTQGRYETGKSEGYIAAMPDVQRGIETEEIVHEEDPLRVLRRLEADGWMKILAPFWTSAKGNAPELDKLRDTLAQIQMQGIHPDTAAAHFPLVTAKLTAKEVGTLKAGFLRQGFVAEIDALEAEAREFATQLGSKAATLPSQAWRMIMAAKPEAVLQVAYSTKSAPLQAKFKSFFTEWPLARQKMPYVLMQEMRIVPDLPEYESLLEKLFFELMDGKLATPEEMKAFLEPYSPPAPPPPLSMRRPRVARKDAKPVKVRTKKAPKVEEAESQPTAVPETAASSAPVAAQAVAPVEAALKKAAPAKTAVKALAVEPSPARPIVAKGPVVQAPVKTAPAKAAPVKAAPVKAVPVKAAPLKSAPAKTAPVKVAPVTKAPAKKAVPLVKKAVPAKKVVPVKKPLSATRSVPAKKGVAKPVAKVVAPVKKSATVSAKAPAKRVAAKAPVKKIAAKVAVKAAVKVVGQKLAPIASKSKPAAAKGKPAPVKGKVVAVKGKAATKSVPAKGARRR
jgi:tRNA nucleotidyltransferase (CCA-adding enzyme)